MRCVRKCSTCWKPKHAHRRLIQSNGLSAHNGIEYVRSRQAYTVSSFWIWFLGLTVYWNCDVIACTQTVQLCGRDGDNEEPLCEVFHAMSLWWLMMFLFVWLVPPIFIAFAPFGASATTNSSPTFCLRPNLEWNDYAIMLWFFFSKLLHSKFNSPIDCEPLHTRITHIID